MIVGVIMFTLCIMATVTQGQGELPVEISPMTIPSTIGECPSDDNRQASRDLLRNATREIINQIYVSPLPESVYHSVVFVFNRFLLCKCMSSNINFLTLGAHAQQGYSSRFVCLCTGFCLLPRYLLHT